ncbi:MAG: deaminase [Candidatus Omnitrophica bacterium]|nr:deaminase [Candidatus Omnitrophota bacterium]
MSTRKITSLKAPIPVGPYSQAVEVGGFLFVSGQIPIDPASGEIAGTGGIKDDTRIVLGHIVNILAEIGLELSDIVKVEVFLKDLGDLKDMNEVYSIFFHGEIQPARVVIEAAKLPKNARIEMSCIAVKRA